MTIRIIILILLLISGCIASVDAQQLKPTEIIYSRTVTNMNAPPTGANSPTIWVVGQDGSNDRFITNGTGPRISDDGRFLLFKRFSLTSSFDPFGIFPEFFVRELATGQETRIIAPSFDEPSAGHFFSPASNQGNFEIVYSAGGSVGACLSKINRDGTNRVQFPCSAPSPIFFDRFPAVRRGGDQLIAFSNNLDTSNVGGIYTVGIDGTSRQKIPNTDCRDFHPVWSNDNQFIAFGTIYTACSLNFPSITTYPYWVSNLFRISPDGNSRQQLTNFPTNPDCSLPSANCLTLGYVWAENNSRIITAGRINGVKGLFAFNANGSGAFTQIPIAPGNAPDYVGGIVQPRVEQNVVSAGGGVTSGGNYSLVSTIGEAIAGITSTGGPFSVQSGFWAGSASATASRTRFDYDGDGKSDISVWRPSDGVWYILQSLSSSVRAQGWGLTNDRLGPADFDGDGKTDLAVFRESDSNWYIVNSSDNTVTVFGWGLPGDLPVPADYNGDQKADIAVYRPSESNWYRRDSDGQIHIYAWGIAGDKPAPADFNGDGVADMTVFRPSEGRWYTINSGDASIGIGEWGISGDIPIPADYSGDGRADFCVFRPSNSTWYRIHSNDFTIHIITWGLAGDLPVPGDYDGDGRSDLAVWRPSDTTWYLNTTTSGIYTQPFGLTGDKPTPNAFVY